MARQPVFKPPGATTQTVIEHDDGSTKQVDLFDKPTGPLDDGGVEVLQPAEADDKIDVQIVDPNQQQDGDAPGDGEADAADRAPDRVTDGRRGQDATGEITDDELQSYSEGVRKRINQLTRQREEAKRQAATQLQSMGAERQEALRIAEQMYRENMQLRGLSGEAMKLLKAESERKAAAELESAKRILTKAIEEGESEKVAEAQAKLATAAAALENAKNWSPPDMSQAAQPNFQRQPQGQPYQQQVGQDLPPPPDERTRQWLRDNPWYTDPGKKQMTLIAQGIHFNLVMQGIQPGTPEYYQAIDTGMKENFPKYFARESGTANQQAPQAATSRKSPEVAPANRGGQQSRSVQLSPSQQAIAKKLGVSLEDYARQFLKLKENANG